MTTIPNLSSGVFTGLPSPAFENQYLDVVHSETSGTAGGTTVSGWQTTPLNNIRANDIGATLTDKIITIPAGVYYCRATTCYYRNGTSKAAIYNVTDSEFILLGKNIFVDSAIQAGQFLDVAGRFTIAAEKEIILRSTTGAYTTYGFGYPAGSGEDEIYSSLELWKLNA